MFTLADLSDDSLDAIKQLEAELGTPLIAVSELSVAPAEIAPDALGKISELEKEVGAVLVAVRN